MGILIVELGKAGEKERNFGFSVGREQDMYIGIESLGVEQKDQ